MRKVGALVILWSLYLFADAAYDDHRGIAEVIPPNRDMVRVASRWEDPKMYQGLMAYQWSRASLALFIGFVLLRLHRGQERVDPLSAEFAGTKAIDELDRVLDAEKRRMNRRIR